jgi:hypothetical protein
MSIRRFVLLVAAAALLAGLAVAPASGAGVTQVSGTAIPGYDMYGAYVGPCNAMEDPFGPFGAEYAIALPNEPGGLYGCIYGGNVVGTVTPSGVYKEVADEVFVGAGLVGTFALTENFHAKYVLPDFKPQLWGFCKHPIVADSGTGVFETGVTGRLDFRDNIEDGNFPYKGHLRVG